MQTDLLAADPAAYDFENAGLVEAQGIASPGVIVNASNGQIENKTTGTIRSINDFGLIVGGDSNSVTNAGRIAADAAGQSATIRAVWIESGKSTFENLEDGAVDGGIIAALSEVDTAQAREFVLNNREGAAITGREAVTVLDARDFNLLNEGTISATLNGLRVGTNEASATITVQNEPTGLFRGTGSETVGLRIRADGANSESTISNVGNIEGVLDGILVLMGHSGAKIDVTNGSATQPGEIKADGFGLDLATEGSIAVRNTGVSDIAAATGIFTRDAQSTSVENAGSIVATGTARQVARGIDSATDQEGGRLDVIQTGRIVVSPFQQRADNPLTAGIKIEVDTASATGSVSNIGTIIVGPESDRRGKGIEAEGQGSVRITNAEAATISAQTGIAVTGSSDVRVENQGRLDIDASQEAVGIMARDIGTTGTFFVQNSGRVTVDGKGAIGISVVAGAASDPGERLSRQISLELDQQVATEIVVTGDDAIGADFDTVAAFIENTGELIVIGDKTFGVRLRGEETLAVLSNELEVFGANAVGLEIKGQRNAVFNGQGSAALPDFGSLLSDRGAEPVRFFSSQFDFSSTSGGQDLTVFPTGKIVVTGDDAIGVSLGGNGNTFVNVLGDSDLGARPGDVIATGSGARALVFKEAGNFAYNAGRLATSGTVAVSGSSGSDILVNDFQIFGQVQLAEGNDVLLVNPGADFDKGADGGAGTDVLLASSGFSADPDNFAITSFDATGFTSFEVFRQVGNRPLILNGTLDVPAVSVEGIMIIAGAVVTGKVKVGDGAFFTGFGRVGDLSVSPTGLFLEVGGTIQIGTSPGTLVVEGDAVIKGELLLEVGATPEESDRLEATGAIDLSDAKLVIEFVGAPPKAGEAIELFSAPQIEGLASADIEFVNLPPDLTISLDPDGMISVGPPENAPPTAAPIDAGSVAEDGGAATIDLLGDAGAADSDGGMLGVANVVVTDQDGVAVTFGLTDATLSIDTTQFADALNGGDSATVTVAYVVNDGQGGVTPNTAKLVVDGLDGPFTWYRDQDDDAFGVDDPGRNQRAYTQPLGFVGVSGDADDNDAAVFPGAPEINDRRDNDQDGEIDEDNTGPVADPEAFDVVKDTPLTVATSTLLEGDSDADGDALAIVGASNARNGTVRLDDKGDGDPSNDEFVFTPTPGFSGPASFEYTVIDGFGGEDLAPVSIMVTERPNQPPVVSAFTADFGEDDVGRKVSLLKPAFVNDPDGDDLDVANVRFTTADSRLLSASTNLETGLFSLGDDQFEDLAVGAKFDLTIDYEVTDGLVSVANRVTVTIAGANDAPVAVDDNGAGFQTDENIAFITASVLSNDSDADSDTLSITGVDTSGTSGLVKDNGNGTFQYDPRGMFDDLVEGEFATDTFSYFITDGFEINRGEVKLTIEGKDSLEPPTPDTIVTRVDFVEASGREKAITLLDGLETGVDRLRRWEKSVEIEAAGLTIDADDGLRWSPDFVTTSGVGIGVRSAFADRFFGRDRKALNDTETLSIQLEDGSGLGDALDVEFAFASLSGSGQVSLSFYDDGMKIEAALLAIESSSVRFDLAEDQTFDRVDIGVQGGLELTIRSVEFLRLTTDEFLYA